MIVAADRCTRAIAEQGNPFLQLSLYIAVPPSHKGVRFILCWNTKGASKEPFGRRSDVIPRSLAMLVNSLAIIVLGHRPVSGCKSGFIAMKTAVCRISSYCQGGEQGPEADALAVLVIPSSFPGVWR